MKKVFIIFLLAALIINTIGYYLISEANIYQIKTASFLNIAKGLETDLSIKFKIPIRNNNKDIDVVDNELVFKGQLFDIAKTEILGDSLVYICIPDASENQLIQNRNNWAADQAGNSTNKKLLSIYNSIQLFCVDVATKEYPIKSCSIPYNTYQPQHFPALHFPVIAPPPQEV